MYDIDKIIKDFKTNLKNKSKEEKIAYLQKYGFAVTNKIEEESKMDKILEDRSRLKTIYIMDNTTGRSIRFDKVTVRDSDEFLDSNGKPQFFIVDKDASDPHYYPYKQFSWKELVKEKSDLITAIKNINKAIEVAEYKNYDTTFAVDLADLRTILDELTRLTIAVETYQMFDKSNNSTIDGLEGLINELRTENKRLKDERDRKSNSKK